MGEATIRDVALRARVSVASVSRALNGLGNVRPSTSERILAAAAELGYVPHAGARSLSLARSHAIGVVLPDVHGDFFSACVRGMDQEAERRGYLLLLANLHGDGKKAAQALRAMRGRVDGLLVMAPHIEAATLAEALPRQLPAVLIASPDIGGRYAALNLDNVGGTRAMALHLLASGCRRILYIAGPEGNIDAAERRAAFIATMKEHDGGASHLVLTGDFTESAGRDAGQQIVAGHIDCDAVFAANDMMAIGCLDVLRGAGIAVPDKVAVAGFDDIQLARYLSLTTVRVPIAEIGARAVASLVDQLEGVNTTASTDRWPLELMVRATTRARL